METELFMHFAEIAGIFVGFGALISLRSARPSDLHDVAYLKSVLALGVWVVIVALLPISISRYGVQEHALWLPCAIAALVLWLVAGIGPNLTPDLRAFNQHLEPVDRLFPVVGLPLHAVIAGGLTLVVVGVFPGLDEALYVTALTAGVIFGGYTLLISVLSQKHEFAASHGGQEQRGADSSADA